MEQLLIITKPIMGFALAIIPIALIISLTNRKRKAENRINHYSAFNLSTNDFFRDDSFFKMVNSGEDLCEDDVSFEFVDYCINSENIFF